MGRVRRTHDGFYFRMSLGLGSTKVQFRDGPPGVKDAQDRGALLDLMLGGTPSPGLVIGGGLWFSSLETNKWKRQNDDPSVGMVAMGPFIDYFPDPHQGFHFGGMLGVAAWRVNVTDLSEPKSTAGGGAVGAWAGYDFWVSPQWSLGVQARYLGMVVENENHDWRGAADTLGLSFTALYH
jgi:hypothetical protein